MKKVIPFITIILLSYTFLPQQATAQQTGLNQIDIPDLETHLSIIASDEMEGRKTGEPGLDLAAEYLAAQALRIGLKPIDSNGDYLQKYTLVYNSADQDKSSISVSRTGGQMIRLKTPFYVLNPDKDEINIKGEVVFAGYGIHSEIDNYNDFEGIDLEGKIVLIMDRGPLNETGDSNLLNNQDWTGQRSFQYKIPELLKQKPKAVLIVMDPKSGNASLSDASPGMARNLSKSRTVKEFNTDSRTLMPESETKIIFIHQDLVMELFRPAGKLLSEYQTSIDHDLKPHSFKIKDTKINIKAAFTHEEKSVPNVVGLIEGNDPEMKKETIIYLAHFDHLGKNSNGEVYNGADDNASGTSALIELGEAFMSEKENLKRSVMMLWVSGEEIGLYGSKFYTEYPIVPLENTIACINLDMIGTVRTERDKGMRFGEKISVMGMDSISLIGGNQSEELMNIHNSVAESLGIQTDLSLNDPDHPYRYYYRSDHINFARNNIPVLFYSTGVHIDYHSVGDDYNRINFTKLQTVCELAYLVGYELATRPERIKVDNPFSDWGKTYR